MKLDGTVIDNVFRYFINQTMKSLYLFEEKDPNGYKHVKQTIGELKGLSFIYPSIAKDKDFMIICSKLAYIEHLLRVRDGEHQEVRNHVFETIKLLNKVKGVMEDENA